MKAGCISFLEIRIPIRELSKKFLIINPLSDLVISAYEKNDITIFISGFLYANLALFGLGLIPEAFHLLFISKYNVIVFI